MKKKINMKVLSIVLSTLVCVSLIGCGAAEQNAKSDTETADATETVTESADTESTEEAFVTEEALSETESETEETTEDSTATVSSPQTETSEYTYTDMSATMYATTSVNVRNLPSTDGEKLGTLSYNQAVTVTGKCNETGWYRIEYNSGTGYVSNNYLSESKGATKSASASSSTSSNNASSNTENTNVSTEWHIDRAASEELWRLINEERVANGVAALTWDESMYATSCQRAQELTSNYSHDGAAGAAEIIDGPYVSKGSTAYYDFYNSSAHHEIYMKAKYASGACAIYTNGVSGYCSVNFNRGTTSSDSSSDSSSNSERQVTASDGTVVGVYGGNDMSDEELQAIINDAQSRFGN